MENISCEACIHMRQITRVTHNLHVSPKMMTFLEFKEQCHINGDKFGIPIKSTQRIYGKIKVYDFETTSDNHNFVANSIISSNCVVATPEHGKVGLVKNLTLISSITIGLSSQLELLYEYLKPKIINLRDVISINLKDYTKVFLNGDWLGMSDKPFDLVGDLRERRKNGIIDITVSIIHAIVDKEIRLYTDGGRLFRPLLKVNPNNTLQLLKDDLKEISLNKKNKTAKINTWDQFLALKPGRIEYLDVEEAAYSMIAPMLSDVVEMRHKMNESVKLAAEKFLKNKEKQTQILNRYDEFAFIRYTHVELHPSLLLDIVVTNIPFSDHNQGPGIYFITNKVNNQWEFHQQIIVIDWI